MLVVRTMQLTKYGGIYYIVTSEIAIEKNYSPSTLVYRVEPSAYRRSQVTTERTSLKLSWHLLYRAWTCTSNSSTIWTPHPRNLRRPKLSSRQVSILSSQNCFRKLHEFVQLRKRLEKKEFGTVFSATACLSLPIIRLLLIWRYCFSWCED